MPKARVHTPKETYTPPAETHGLIVYAAFENFKEGDKFIIPAGWVRDEAYEQLIFTKNKPRAGMVFVTPKEKRVTVPVMEA